MRSDWFLLGRDLQYGPFPWKQSPCIFVLEQSRQIQNLQPKLQKNVNIVILHSKLPEKAKKIKTILLRFQRWMKKMNILRVSSVLS